METTKYIMLTGSSALILVAFFAGILFEKASVKALNNMNKEQKYYVNLEVLKTKLKITNDNPQVIVTIDGEVLNEKKTVQLMRE